MIETPKGMIGCREAGEMIGCSNATARTLWLNGELRGVMRPVPGAKRMKGWIYLERESVEEWLTDPRKAKVREALAARVKAQAVRDAKRRQNKFARAAAEMAAVPNGVSEGCTKVEPPEPPSGTFFDADEMQIVPPDLSLLSPQTRALLAFLEAGGHADSVRWALAEVGDAFHLLAGRMP